MSTWTRVPAAEVCPGDCVRLPNGEELSVTRVDPDHLGLPQYVKLVEDTDERWLCIVLPKDRDVEVVRTS